MKKATTNTITHTHHTTYTCSRKSFNDFLNILDTILKNSGILFIFTHFIL
jgi:hypothetical protein